MMSLLLYSSLVYIVYAADVVEMLWEGYGCKCVAINNLL